MEPNPLAGEGLQIQNDDLPQMTTEDVMKQFEEDLIAHFNKKCEELQKQLNERKRGGGPQIDENAIYAEIKKKLTEGMEQRIEDFKSGKQQ